MSKNQPYRKHLVLNESDSAGLANLSKGQREAIQATQAEPRPTYKDLALAFNVPVGTIRSRLSRARDGILAWRFLQ